MSRKHKKIVPENPKTTKYSTKKENGAGVAENINDAPEEVLFRQPKLLKKRKTKIIVLVSLISAVVLAGLVFLCIWLFSSEPYDRTAEFYFSSDYLTEEGGEFAQEGAISFELYNYADALRTSIYDVESVDISVKCDDKDITKKCTVEKTDESIPANQRGKIGVKITLPEEYAKEKVEVSAVSDPINIELKGTFSVTPEWSYELVSEKGSIYAALIISSDISKTFKIKWDTDELIADSTDFNVDESEKEGECYVSLGESESYELVFFKKDTDKEYSGCSEKLPVEVTLKNGGEDK